MFLQTIQVFIVCSQERNNARESPYVPYQDIIDNKKKNFYVGHMLAR